VHQNAQPKSGTTWLENIVNLMVHQYCSANGCTALQDEDAPDPRDRRQVLVSSQEWQTLVDLNADGEKTNELWLRDKHKLFPYEAVGTPPKYPKTPAPLEVMTTPAFKQQLFEFAAHMKKHRTCIVGLLRDPRDVVLSACHYVEGSACRPEEYLKANLNATLSWTQLRFNIYNELSAMIPDRFFVLYFEDLKEDFQGTVGHLAEQLGFPLGAESLAAIEHETSFSRLKHMETDGVLNGKSRRTGHGDKIRRGAACGFSSEVDSPTAAWSTSMFAKYATASFNERFSCPETLVGTTGSIDQELSKLDMQQMTEP
jgi:hypothetical protein